MCLVLSIFVFRLGTAWLSSVRNVGLLRTQSSIIITWAYVVWFETPLPPTPLIIVFSFDFFERMGRRSQVIMVLICWATHVLQG